MSRIAKNPIQVPNGVNINLEHQTITVKGPKGELTATLNDKVACTVDDAVIRFDVRDQSKNARAQSGTARAIVSNMVTGVHQGFERKLELVGVGYRAQSKGSTLNLTLGFSHPVEFPVPQGVSIETPSQTEILIKGADKQVVGQVAAEIRSFRPPEPYKGKGVRYSDERISLKEAKKK